MNSTAASSALYVSTGFKTAVITVKNVVWSGRNYYGMVCVYDDAANAGVSIVFENVRYNGPQAIYNRYGSTTVKNCDITIEKNGSSASAQEFSFASDGTVAITAKQVNYWNKSVTPYTAAGGFDDIPTTAIYKANGETVTITQTLTQSAVTATASDLTEGDGGYPLGAANFDLTKATVLSAGTLPLSINAVNDLSLEVSGSTDASRR